MSQNPVSVLFVCTGNICRSPTAEAVFRHQVQEAGLEKLFTTDSAGTHGYHIGDPPDPRAIATALGRGVDMRDLRARKFEGADFDQFNYIFAMDRSHYAFMERLKGPSPKGTMALYLAQALGNKTFPLEVPDPYYGTLQGFEDVYDLIEKASHRLLAWLAEKHRG